MSLRAIAWVTLVIAPVLLLLLIQVQFLPFHNSFITWTHRVALLADLVLVWWLWRKIISRREIKEHDPIATLNAFEIGLLLSIAAVLFSSIVATFPGEWQEDFLARWDKPRLAVSLHDWVFDSEVDDTTFRRRLPFSSTLVLSGFNVLDGLGIDDPEKAKWRDFVFRARGRDLKGAILDLATLPRVDFAGAKLQGATFLGANLEGASLDDAELAGASLLLAHLRGASLDRAWLQGAQLDAAELQGASLSGAELQGASLFGAELQGATLDGVFLGGASLNHAQLQGASLQLAQLTATDLSGTLLWRTNRVAPSAVHQPGAVRLPNASDQWLPLWKDQSDKVHPWNEGAYEEMRRTMEFSPVGQSAQSGAGSYPKSRLRRSGPDARLLRCVGPAPRGSSSVAKVIERRQHRGQCVCQGIVSGTEVAFLLEWRRFSLRSARAFAPSGPCKPASRHRSGSAGADRFHHE